jgi:alpha-galactosidase
MDEAHSWAASAFTAESPAFSFVYGGRSSSEFLKGWEVKSEEIPSGSSRVVRSVTFTDPQTKLEARCIFVEFAGFPAVEWVMTFRNGGDKDTPILENALPLDWRAPWSEGGATVHYSLGDSNSEKSFAPLTRRIAKEEGSPFIFGPTGGRSSEDYLPFINLAGRDRGVALAIGWSGQWESRFEYDNGDLMRAASGMQLTHLLLHPGESIRTPRMLLVFWDGDDPMRGSNIMRQLLIARYLPRRNGELVMPPICGTVGEADPDGSYEGPHIRPMIPFGLNGIEAFWSDMDPQQWYPVGFPEGTGTWEPDLAKYPHGLRPIGDAAHAAGIEYLLWFEPERTTKISRIAREHPEWTAKGADGGLFRLDIPEARKWLTDYIDVQVTDARIDWMRWDFNTQPIGAWRKNDSEDRQGMTEIRYIEGLYAMWDDYRERHPGLVIDLCASGGRRIDIESLQRGLPLWHSDMPCLGYPKPEADQLQNSGLFRWIPLHGAPAFEPEPSYAFRSCMTPGNLLLPGLTKEALDNPEPNPNGALAKTIAAFAKRRPYMLGDFYPLFPHESATNIWYGYQFHRADLDAGMVMVFRREGCAESETKIALKGLSPERSYEIVNGDTGESRVATGGELSAYVVSAPKAPSAVALYYKEKQ